MVKFLSLFLILITFNAAYCQNIIKTHMERMTVLICLP